MTVHQELTTVAVFSSKRSGKFVVQRCNSGGMQSGGEQRKEFSQAESQVYFFIGGGGGCRRLTWVVFAYPIAGHFYCQIR